MNFSDAMYAASITKMIFLRMLIQNIAGSHQNIKNLHPGWSKQF